MKSDDLSMDLCFMIMRLQLRYIWHKLPISCWTVPRGAVKAVLLKLLLMQELKNGAVVCIADFKGGVDFPTVRHNKCQICFDENALLELLNGLVKELQRRKGMFRANDSPNLDEYNEACKGTSSPVMR